MWWLLWEVCFENSIKGAARGGGWGVGISLEESVSWLQAEEGKVTKPEGAVQPCCSWWHSDAQETDMEKIWGIMNPNLNVWVTLLKDALQSVSLALQGTSTAKWRVLPRRRYLQLLWLSNGAAPQETASLDGPSQLIAVHSRGRDKKCAILSK